MRRLAKLVTTTVIVIFTWANYAFAETANFDEFATDATVSSISTSLGDITVFGTDPRDPGVNYARVFDSSSPTCGDTDLGTPNAAFGGPGKPTNAATNNSVSLGNILIIQDYNSICSPDDLDLPASDGATIEFDFDNIGAVTIDAISFIDIDGNGPNPRIELFDGSGATIGVLAIPQTLGNGVVTVDISTSGVLSMTVFLQGSGGMTGFEFNPELTASLGDRVWEDRNADGMQACIDGGANNPMFPSDGIVGNAGDSGAECDAGIAVVDVVLYENPDGDSACNNGDEVIVGTTFTDDNGFYEFNDLDSNRNYCVNFDRADAALALECNPIIGEATFSPEGAGSDSELDSNADVDSGRTGNIQSNEFNLSWDAGIYCPAKIGDRLVDDANGDGIQDVTETGIGDQIVDLFECVNGVPGNMPIRSTTTAGDGMYMFNPLPPGEYAVRFTNPGGTVFSPMDQADDAIDCDTDVNGMTGCIDLTANEYDDSVDACVNRPPSAGLGDFVFEDKNANGKQDGGEPGIKGVPVTLLTPGANGCGTGDEVPVSATSTGLNGEYMFVNLDGGAYCVEFDKSAVSCEFGTATYSPQNATADDLDSDVNPMNNQTGVINLPDGVFDPTWDAGIYCPAKIGDTVWEDLDSDGIQDDVPNTEPGSQGVTVNLLDCAGKPVADLNGDSTLQTDGFGMYMFNVNPGDYMIEFVAPGGRIFTTENAAGSTDTNDSDANAVSGRTSCISVPSNVFDDTLDAGLVDPPECGIGLMKTCEVITPPAPQLEQCSQKLNSFTLIWNGSGPINISGIANDAPGGAVSPGDVVTFPGPFAQNDNILSISGAANGESKFHISCSDEEMDGETDDPTYPNDCGRAEGDGKGNDSGLINDWLLEGLSDGSGQVVNCTADPQPSTSSCEFSATTASCETLPDKPTLLSFQYSGGGCSASDNSQGSKTSCSGATDSSEAVSVTTSAGENFDVSPGESFTITKDGSNTVISLSNSGGTETSDVHTSCSAPLITGEVFGSLTLTALDGIGSGKDVLYSYLVENLGSGFIGNISVTDDKLGSIGSGLSLNPGESETLTAVGFISETTTNVATATGVGSPGAQCIATSSATVTVLPPPPCSVASNFKDLKDDAVKFEVRNTSGRVATLDTLTLDFPSEFGTIKEVKLDGAIYKSDDSPLVINSGDTISAGDWTEENASKRDLDPGEERTLEIKFSDNYKDAVQLDFSGTATFEQGCSVSL